MSDFKIVSVDGQELNRILIVFHLESGDYDYSECGTIGAAIEAAVSEIPAGYESRDQLIKEITEKMKWYWPSEALKAAEDGYSWPVKLGFVEECTQE